MSNQATNEQYACDVGKLDALLAEDGCKRLSVAITDFEGECGVIVLQQIHQMLTGEGCD